jgi:hypothetical protein
LLPFLAHLDRYEAAVEPGHPSMVPPLGSARSKHPPTKPGITVWMSLWNNDREQSAQERLGWLRSDASPNAFDVSVEANSTPARYFYRLNEHVVFALYGFVLKDEGHLQIVIYLDKETDLEKAKALLDSVR